MTNMQLWTIREVNEEIRCLDTAMLGCIDWDYPAGGQRFYRGVRLP
jgi:hypothetical protein